MPEYWANYRGGPLAADDNLRTGIDAAEIGVLAKAITKAPEGFHLHAKVKKTVLDPRIEMGEGRKPFDYGTAELVAYASLLKAGTPVRLTGQDSQRGTFNQRHSVLIDIETEQRFSPLSAIAPDQGRWQVYNSLLSEAGCLGYEYGYSRDYPGGAGRCGRRSLGILANGAQIIIDQFISASEAKWGLLSGVDAMLSCRMGIRRPGTGALKRARGAVSAACGAGQYSDCTSRLRQHSIFICCGRQAMRKWRKLAGGVYTESRCWRHPDAMSPIAEFGGTSFRMCCRIMTMKDPRRVLVCTGKIGHNLRVDALKRAAI